ncbi:hypothetical protein ACQCVB_20125 [Fictibacillus phosphorivorans]|uniref:hypothetical protein n=1 Tax=Fictibacillus phosphorivorans TaxID=1221500 RepID=UPI003CF9BB36
MTYDEQIRMLLNKVKADDLTSEPLPGMTQERYFSLIEDCERNGYISTFMRQIVFRYMGGGELADGIALTKKGHDFLDNKDRNQTIPLTQQFHIQTVSNSNFGNHGTINNNYGIQIDDLLKFIEKNVDVSDQAQARELIETIQHETELKPGVLKRFDTLLEKYPGLSSNVGNLVMTFLTSGAV